MPGFGNINCLDSHWMSCTTQLLAETIDKEALNSLVAAHFCTKRNFWIFGGGARMFGWELIRVSAIRGLFSTEVIVSVQDRVSAIQSKRCPLISGLV